MYPDVGYDILAWLVSPKNIVLFVGMLTRWNVETPVVFSPTINVSALKCVVLIPDADTLVKPLPSPTKAVAVAVPVTVIPAFVVCNLAVLFQFKVADPPFENVAYVALPAAFFKLNAFDLISDTLIAFTKVVTPATETLSKLV